MTIKNLEINKNLEIMKAKINNHDIECSVEEFIRLLEWERSERISKVTELVNEKPSHIVRGQRPMGQTRPKMVMVERPGLPAVTYNSIREAQREVGLDFNSFSLARCLRLNDGVVEVDGMLFMLLDESGSVATKPKEEEKEFVYTEPEDDYSAKKQRKMKMKYKLIYADGDHRLINLSSFCKRYKLPYEHIRSHTGKSPYEYGGFTFEKV